MRIRFRSVSLIFIGSLLNACGGSGDAGTTSDEDTGVVLEDASLDTNTCGAGQDLCGGKCVDRTSDPANCGACGTACKTGEVCSVGKCALSCGGGTTICDGLCKDTQSDANNCGACGTKCAAGEVCSVGKCAASCGGGTTICSGVCRDTKTDRANCGACGTACKDGEVCSDGACKTSCGGGTTECSGVCRDTATDRLNCGACGTACKAGEVCSAGKCGLSCGSPLTLCSGSTGGGGDAGADADASTGDTGTADTGTADTGTADTGTGDTATGDAADADGGTSGGTAYCANLSSDITNCGGCGVVCGAGKTCNAGHCEVTCGPGLVDCGDGKCRDLSADNSKCGTSCSTAVACGAGKVCSGGACSTSCGGGLVDCGDGVCRDTTTDRTKCGTGCSTAVACASGQVCTGGACATTCTAGTVDCGDGKCRDLSTDNAKCGSSCSTAVTCAAGTVCSGGTCGTTCTAGTVDCGDGKCRDLSTDNAKCGTSCGTAVTCAAGTVCTGGSCKASCGAGQIVCGGACVDPKTNNTYCGASGDCTTGTNKGTTCAAGTSCVGGVCNVVGVAATSCRQLHVASPSLPSGTYTIDTDGPAGPKPPVAVYCDMVTDGGGYTWVKLTDSTLLSGAGHQASYFNACAAYGMEVVVPRTKAHAVAMAAYGGGQLPNLYNVYPNVNGNHGIWNWHGTCQGAKCTFWMTDDATSDGSGTGNVQCAGFEPNGDNNTANAIYRYSSTTIASACGNGVASGVPGQWNDANDNMDIGGYVWCSTNDYGPANGEADTDAATSCNAIHTAYPTLPSGAYWLDPDGPAGADAPFLGYCDMVTDGGGWTAVYKTSTAAATDASTLWGSAAAVNEGAADCANPTTTGASSYCVNRYVTKYWNTGGVTFTSARVHALTAGVVKAFMRFDGLTADKTGWFGQAKLASSSWADLATAAPNFFSISGDSQYGRNWFANTSYGGCGADTGWFVVSSTGGATNKPCTWETSHGTGTRIFYSSAATETNWNTAANVANADVMMVFVR